MNLGILETKHKCTTLLSTDLAWIFHYFCERLFVLCSPVKKEGCLILGNCRIIYLILVCAISIKFINYISDWLNWIPSAFLKHDKLFDLEIYIVKLKYTDTTTPLKMEIKLVYTEGNFHKDRKNHELNCSMFQLSTTIGRRNNFHIFVSLPMKSSENELTKIYCVPRF